MVERVEFGGALQVGERLRRALQLAESGPGVRPAGGEFRQGLRRPPERRQRPFEVVELDQGLAEFEVGGGEVGRPLDRAAESTRRSRRVLSFRERAAEEQARDRVVGVGFRRGLRAPRPIGGVRGVEREPPPVGGSSGAVRRRGVVGARSGRRGGGGRVPADDFDRAGASPAGEQVRGAGHDFVLPGGEEEVGAPAGQPGQRGKQVRGVGDGGRRRPRPAGSGRSAPGKRPVEVGEQQAVGAFREGARAGEIEREVLRSARRGERSLAALFEERRSGGVAVFGAQEESVAAAAGRRTVRRPAAGQPGRSAGFGGARPSGRGDLGGRAPELSAPPRLGGRAHLRETASPRRL